MAATYRATIPVFTLLGLAALWAGCGGNAKGSGFGGGDDGGSSGGDASSSGGDGSMGGDGPNLFGDGGGDGTANCSTCSADLHQVLDCNTPPHVLMTCPADQGCGANGQCVPACAAASANKSSIGCDYYTIPSDGWSNIPLNPDVNLAGGPSDGSCFAAFVTNNWGTPMKVSLDYNGMTIDASPYTYVPTGSGASISYMPIPSTGIPANSMGIVFLAQYGTVAGMFKVLCPASVHAAITSNDVGLHGTGIGTAIHLTTTVPATVYDIYPYGGALSYISSATLLLPTDVWDVNYVAVSAAAGQPFTPGSTTQGEPMDVEVIALQDKTTVQILPKAAIAAGGAVPASAANTMTSFTLNKGQLLQFAQLEDLSGSVISSSAPVGVWGGHYCMNLPDSMTSACDAAHQEIPPVKAAGSEYVAVRYRTRTPGTEETVPWRIMGMVSGTTLTYDPPQPTAPPTLNVGQLVEFQSTGPFDVKSQDAKHPFYIAGHMTGGSLAGGLGDPETVNIAPPAQYLPKYIFFTDPTYSETNLVLVQGKDSTGAYPPVTLDCIPAPLTGWQPVGGSGYQYTRIDVQTGHMPVGGCDNGLHVITSSAPFGITVWGFDQYVSYAYPAGASVKPINNVIVPPTPQ
jgi:hypothetical protein